MCLHGRENQNIRKGETQGEAIISHRRSVHTFHISQFFCLRSVNSSVAHLTRVNIMNLFEFIGVNALSNTIHTSCSQTDINMTGRDAPFV